MKTYIFRIEVEQDEDGRWSAAIPTLPGCATWGYTKEEALANLKDAAEAYLADVIEAGEAIPPASALEVIEEPVLTVTV